MSIMRQSLSQPFANSGTWISDEEYGIDWNSRAGDGIDGFRHSYQDYASG